VKVLGEVGLLGAEVDLGTGAWVGFGAGVNLRVGTGASVIGDGVGLGVIRGAAIGFPLVGAGVNLGVGMGALVIGDGVGLRVIRGAAIGFPVVGDGVICGIGGSVGSAVLIFLASVGCGVSRGLTGSGVSSSVGDTAGSGVSSSVGDSTGSGVSSSVGDSTGSGVSLSSSSRRMLMERVNNSFAQSHISRILLAVLLLWQNSDGT
jgi:hypothetical protein